jgi:hypothetical protein
VRTPPGVPLSIAASSSGAATRPTTVRLGSKVVKRGRQPSTMTSQLSKPMRETSSGALLPDSLNASDTPPMICSLPQKIASVWGALCSSWAVASRPHDSVQCPKRGPPPVVARPARARAAIAPRARRLAASKCFMDRASRRRDRRMDFRTTSEERELIYYAWCMSQVRAEAAPVRLRKGSGRYPQPVAPPPARLGSGPACTCRHRASVVASGSARQSDADEPRHHYWS